MSRSSSQPTDDIDTTTISTGAVTSSTVQLLADDQTCSDVVRSAEYVITHNASNIISVELNAILDTLNVTNNGFQHQHSVRFIPLRPLNSVDGYTEPRARSGNPGYLNGYPVLGK